MRCGPLMKLNTTAAVHNGAVHQGKPVHGVHAVPPSPHTLVQRELPHPPLCMGLWEFSRHLFLFSHKMQQMLWRKNPPPPLLLKPISVLCPTSVLELNQVRVEYINKKYIYYSTLHNIYIFVYLLILYPVCVYIY